MLLELFGGWEVGRSDGREGEMLEMILESWQLPNTLCPWQHLLSLPRCRQVRWRKTAADKPTAAGSCAGLRLCQRKRCQAHWPAFKWLGVLWLARNKPREYICIRTAGHLLLPLSPSPHPFSPEYTSAFQSVFFRLLFRTHILVEHEVSQMLSCSALKEAPQQL